MYGEYRSLPFASNTPVLGAELNVSQSPAKEHFESFIRAGSLGTFPATRDTDRSTSGESWRVDVVSTEFEAGLMTNEFWLTSFEHSAIEFDLFFPADSIAQVAMTVLCRA
jgi:hypothetical protein